MTDVRILAFDTSGPHCAASLLVGGEIIWSHQEAMKKGQAERLMPLLEGALSENGIGWPEIDAIGVGVGPGNFTGVRIAVSAARGLVLAMRKPAIGVTLFEALRGREWFGDTALQYVVAPSSRRGNDVIAQRFSGARPVGDVLEGAFDPADGGDKLAIPVSADPHSTLGPQDLAERFSEFSKGGSGPTRHAEFSDEPDQRLTDRIAHVAALKLASGEAIARPAPLYIRPADAAPPSDLPPVILG